MKTKLFLFLLPICFYTACTRHCDQYPAQMNYFMFGHFYGMCSGERCIEIYRIQDNAVHEDIIDQYPARDDFYQGNYVKLSQQYYQLVKDLPADFPPGLWAESNSVIGGPDQADGGGLYLEYNFNGMHRFWLIDNNKNHVPVAYHAFIDKVRDKISVLP